MDDKPDGNFWVGSGEGRLGERLEIGNGSILFKVTTEDSKGTLLVAEIAHQGKGGPGRHFHHHQDEWFHVLEGEYLFEIGQERTLLRAGDSCFGPRMVPHAWFFVGDGTGRLVFVFTPAGLMEAFFRTMAATRAMPGQDKDFFRAHGMEIVGPPL